MQHCQRCSAKFETHETALAFLTRYAIPAPLLCPDCRQQRRAAFRNSRTLYRRNCDLSGASIVSLYSPDKPFKVYESQRWWGDSWEPRQYARAFNFDRPFFPQFAALMQEVPRPALFNKGSENSAYTNHAVYNKNCYLCFNAGYCEDTYYSGDVVVRCKSSADLSNVIDGELLLECVDCTRCYNCWYVLRCVGCSDSRFLFDCHGCNHCLLCCNLRNRSYCIHNQQYSRQEYFEKLSEYDFGSYRAISSLQTAFHALVANEAAQPATVHTCCEDVGGDYLSNSKSVIQSFDVRESQDLRYCYDAWDIKDCMDTFQTMDKAEQHYETHASSVSIVAAFCNISHENHDIQYCDHCFNSGNLFGCIGLRREQYCILNQRYSKEEYEALVPKIIAHMRSTGEYGEFFPARLSPFGYNETVAQDWYPLSQEKAGLDFGWCSYQAPAGTTNAIDANEELPDHISQVTDALCSKSLSCAHSGRAFRIIPQELALYRTLGAPLPRLHPDVRYQQRLRLRNQRQFRLGVCNRCNAQVETTVPPHAATLLLCQKCYSDVVYE